LVALDSGEPTTGSSRFLRFHVAEHDATMVQRYRSAGLIILGRTNTPEFGLVAVTGPEFRGPARKPVASRPDSRWLQWRGRGRHCGRVHTCSSRRGRRRINPDSRFCLRRVRSETIPGSQSGRSGILGHLVGPGPGARHHPLSSG
jgi:hypothetical protein